MRTKVNKHSEILYRYLSINEFKVFIKIKSKMAATVQISRHFASSISLKVECIPCEIVLNPLKQIIEAISMSSKQTDILLI